jgi:hypothetical protein
LGAVTPVMQAAWLLLRGAPESRLEALSRLDALRGADFIALKVWRDAAGAGDD